MLDDLLAVGCCSLDVRVELLNVCLELLDAGSLRGVGLRRGVARRRRRELRLELGHALGERLARLLAGAELAGGVVETRGEICDSRFLRVGNLSGWVGHRHDRRGHKRRAVVRGADTSESRGAPRARPEPRSPALPSADLRSRQNGPNGRVRESPASDTVRKPALTPYSVFRRPPCCSAREFATAPGDANPSSTRISPSGWPVRSCSASACVSWSEVTIPSSTMSWPSWRRRLSWAASTVLLSASKGRD